jgi:hypothetical protein
MTAKDTGWLVEMERVPRILFNGLPMDVHGMMHLVVDLLVVVDTMDKA